MMVTDARAVGRPGLSDRVAKSAKMQMAAGAKLATADDVDYAEAKNTFNYRVGMAPNGDRNVRLVDHDGRRAESANSQLRRHDPTNYRATTAADVEHNARYGDNTSKERHTAGLGSKYMNRFIERDNTGDEIAAGN
jgi:hypothetical protein